MTRTLITGGAGFIGSHACVEFVQTGQEVVVLDNLSNASLRSIHAVERITQKNIPFVEGDIRDADVLGKLFHDHEIDSVIHFAGLKAVGESVEQPLKYFDNNVNGTLRLIEAMTNAGVKTIVFSSSATVYGTPEHCPISESAPTGAVNPYGRSKLMVEQMLQDLFASDPAWRISLLRYFNPVGAHASGEIGEDPNGIPNNLMPYISQVAIGKLPFLRVFGDDYPTPDGTGIRDYIHVVDLARAHVQALKFLRREPRIAIHNLGTGQGYSVLDVLKAFETACGRKLPFEITDRRSGDVAESYADPTKANCELEWRAEFGIEKMCADSWRWQSSHPEGFAD
ncbi:MAG: UDP-glucose 4-epimerase GalE [Proteobacteria bacterium]|nr:UDP-glucose 4-epimerase GalE [Pseudomonadota bacterium]